jgi:hypothetical protein
MQHTGINRKKLQGLSTWEDVIYGTDGAIPEATYDGQSGEQQNFER